MFTLHFLTLFKETTVTNYHESTNFMLPKFPFCYTSKLFSIYDKFHKMGKSGERKKKKGGWKGRIIRQLSQHHKNKTLTELIVLNTCSSDWWKGPNIHCMNSPGRCLKDVYMYSHTLIGVHCPQVAE